VEITWLGETCLRLRGREGVVAADAYRSVVGPTGRGLTADVCTYSHADAAGAPSAGKRGRTNGAAGSPNLGVIPPTSLEAAFPLDAPGEYEVHDILVTGVRTWRDEAKGADRGANTAFVFELDGIHVIHLGDVGHLLNEEMLGEVGSVQVACVPIGSALSAARAAELVAQLDPGLVVPMPVGDDPDQVARALDRFLREMGVTDQAPVPRIQVSISTVPQETTVVVLGSRAKG
jgi:L-ascorbate metabolism protein UlaG (beta-lactamase superfamily)